MRRTRIFGVIASSDVGGAEEMFLTLLRGLDRERYDISIACHGRDRNFDEYARSADRIWPLDLVRLTRVGTIGSLAGLIRESRADIVHTYLWTADTLGGLAARRAGVRRTVATVTAAYHLPIDVTGLARAARLVKSGLYRATYRLFDRVIACSEYVAADLRDRTGLRVPAGKIDVIYNVTDPRRIERAATEGDLDPTWMQGSPVISTIANFYPIKGHAPLIRAIPRVVRQHPRARFVLVGDGPTRTDMENLADALGVRAHLAFTGRVPYGPRVIAGSDLVVVPSISEGLGIVLLEALVLGVPVVATRAGAIPEILGDDEAGLLAAPDDPASLAEAILRALADPAATRGRVARGRAVVRERFSVETMVRGVDGVYRGLMGGAS
jgi:glycosyltransferase involved in cell wall biosynthesis